MDHEGLTSEQLTATPLARVGSTETERVRRHAGRWPGHAALARECDPRLPLAVSAGREQRRTRPERLERCPRQRRRHGESRGDRPVERHHLPLLAARGVERRGGARRGAGRGHPARPPGQAHRLCGGSVERHRHRAYLGRPRQQRHHRLGGFSSTAVRRRATVGSAGGRFRTTSNAGAGTISHRAAVSRDEGCAFRIRALTAIGAGPESEEIAFSALSGLENRPVASAEGFRGGVRLAWTWTGNAAVRWQTRHRPSDGTWGAWGDHPGVKRHAPRA